VRKRNPLSDLDKILQDSRYPRHNHLCKCWWPSVKGFRDSDGSNFALPYSLWLSSLQHSCTTVWLCDECITSVLTIVFWDLSRSKPETHLVCLARFFPSFFPSFFPRKNLLVFLAICGLFISRSRQSVKGLLAGPPQQEHHHYGAVIKMMTLFIVFTY